MYSWSEKYHPGILQIRGMSPSPTPSPPYSQDNWGIQPKGKFSSALLNETSSYCWVPKGKKIFSVLEAASHAAVRRSPHTTHCSFNSNLFSQWQMNHRNQSQVWLWKIFPEDFFFFLKVKMCNLRLHNKRQTKWMCTFAEAKCVVMRFGTIWDCGEICESRARTHQSLNHKSLSPLATWFLIWATSSRLYFLA